VLDVSGVESLITESVISSVVSPKADEVRNLNEESRIKNLELRIGKSTPMINDSQFMIQLEGKIILIKTRNSLMDWARFHEDFVALDESAARYLVSVKPKLIGIDGPSIKKFRVPDQTHQIILSNNIPIIEWLDLSKVEAGLYQFIGFPLFLKSLDGSPLRAILTY
jgi:kynurenine formamidase